MVLQTWSSHHNFFNYSVNIYTLQRCKLQNQPEKLRLIYDLSIIIPYKNTNNDCNLTETYTLVTPSANIAVAYKFCCLITATNSAKVKERL